MYFFLKSVNRTHSQYVKQPLTHFKHTFVVREFNSLINAKTKIILGYKVVPREIHQLQHVPYIGRKRKL